MMLDIITKLYESEHFTTGLICIIAALVLIFAVILFKALKDIKQEKGEPITPTIGEEKDISFEPPVKAVNEYEPAIKEDVTFEQPVLTQNLADFKNVIEQEIKEEVNTEEEVKPLEKIQAFEEDNKPIKILDIDEIEDTSIFPSLDGSAESLFSYADSEDVNIEMNQFNESSDF